MQIPRIPRPGWTTRWLTTDRVPPSLVCDLLTAARYRNVPRTVAAGLGISVAMLAIWGAFSRQTCGLTRTVPTEADGRWPWREVGEKEGSGL